MNEIRTDYSKISGKAYRNVSSSKLKRSVGVDGANFSCTAKYGA